AASSGATTTRTGPAPPRAPRSRSWRCGARSGPCCWCPSPWSAGARADRPPPVSDRRLVAALAVAAVAVVVALAVLGARDDGGGERAGGPGATTTTVDLSSVPNEELERVVAENPGVVPMRLRLVER